MPKNRGIMVQISIIQRWGMSYVIEYGERDVGSFYVRVFFSFSLFFLIDLTLSSRLLVGDVSFGDCFFWAYHAIEHSRRSLVS